MPFVICIYLDFCFESGNNNNNNDGTISNKLEIKLPIWFSFEYLVK